MGKSSYEIVCALEMYTHLWEIALCLEMIYAFNQWRELMLNQLH